MRNRKENTAILIFCQSAIIEAGRKKLISSNEHSNLQSLKFLNNRIQHLAEQSRLPYFITNTQSSGSFGSKLATAYDEIFRKGFDHVIAIGNDCLELNSSDLKSAALLLENGKTVIGPDKRNGAYLIGISRNQFNYEKFSNLKWQSDYTLESLINYSKDYYFLLEQKSDLNNNADFDSLLNRSERKLRRVLSSFKQVIVFYSSHIFFSIRPFFYCNSRRGPPIVT